MKRFLLALLLLAGCGQECNSFGRGFGMGPSFSRGPAPAVLNVGESTVLWTSTEAAATPGVYTSFGTLLEGDAENELIALYHRGLGHFLPQSSQRLVRSTNRGRSWQQLGAETAITDPQQVASSGVTVTSNSAVATVSENHGFVVGQRIYTTGLTTNIASSSPVAITEVGATTIQYPLTAGDGALADGTGVILAAASVRGIRCERFSTDRIGCTYSLNDIGATNPNSSRYKYSDDDGDTWSAAVAMGQQGTSFTFAGASLIELDDGTILATVYSRDTDETRYTARLLESDDEDGATWTERSIIAQDSDPDGLQYETPFCGVRSDDSILCLIREDTTGYAYSFTSDDDGETWTANGQMFPTRQVPVWRTFTNGILVAIASPSGDAGTRSGELYYSRNNGASWSGPRAYLPSAPETNPVNDLQEAGLVECATNIACILSAQEIATNASCRLVYTEVGVGVAAPTSYRNSHAAHWPTAGDTYLDYGNSEYLEAATEATFEFWIRRETNLGGTQHIIARSGASQNAFRVRVTTASTINVGIASSLTAFSAYTSATVIANDVWYHVVIRYLGACGVSTDCDVNAERLRLWVNGTEDTAGSYSGTVPAALTSPNTTAVTQIGAQNGINLLRDFHIAFLRVWGNAIPTANIGDLYNGRVPVSLADADTAVGGSALFSLRFNGNATDEVGFLSAPSETGAVVYSQRTVP